MQFLKLLRPYSWIKNFFIFTPLFFARGIFSYHQLSETVLAFIIFCIAASTVYILNDIVDIEQDRKHTTKKNRPLASGAISKNTALYIFSALLIIDAGLIYFFLPQVGILIGLYFLLNIAYSLSLKHIAIVDILLVSGFYYIRILVGGVTTGIVISHWLSLCSIFISLFLIVGKRIAEYNQEEKRAVLEKYTREFLNTILIVAATLTIVSYSLYSVLVLNSSIGILSIFFVLLGILRYVFIVFTSHKAEYPEKAVISDKLIFISSILWLISMCAIFYL